MKQVILGIIASFVFTSSLLAKDSTWLVGADKTVALNIFEHRDGAASRAIEITLVEGTWFLTGRIKDADSGSTAPVKISLKTKNATFNGTIAIDFSKKKAALKGTLTLQGTAYKLAQTIRCREMAGL